MIISAIAAALLAVLFLGLSTYCDARITKQIGPREFTNEGPAHASFIAALLFAFIAVALCVVMVVQNTIAL